MGASDEWEDSEDLVGYRGDVTGAVDEGKMQKRGLGMVFQTAEY